MNPDKGLGHLINSVGFRPLQDKGDEVARFQILPLACQLRHFFMDGSIVPHIHLKLRQTCRQSCPLLASETHGPIAFSAEESHTFQKLNDASAKAAWLAHPIPNASLSLMVEAPITAPIAVLGQHRGMDRQPLAFFPRLSLSLSSGKVPSIVSC